MFSWEISHHAQFPQCWTLGKSLVVFTFHSPRRIFSLHYAPPLSLQKVYKKVACQQNRSIQLHTEMILYCGKFQCALLPSFMLLHAILVNLVKVLFLLTLKWHVMVLNEYWTNKGNYKKFIVMRVIIVVLYLFSSRNIECMQRFRSQITFITKVVLSKNKLVIPYIYFFTVLFLINALTHIWILIRQVVQCWSQISGSFSNYHHHEKITQMMLENTYKWNIIELLTY